MLNVFEVTENLRVDVNHSCRNLQSCSWRGRVSIGGPQITNFTLKIKTRKKKKQTKLGDFTGSQTSACTDVRAQVE